MKSEARAKIGLVAVREKRYFSESAQREIVSEIEAGLGKSEASRRYGVSETSIYKWWRKHSKRYQKSLVTVVESASATSRVKDLEAQLEAAYALLGRSKAENLVLSAILEEASDDMGIDLKKSIETKRSIVFGSAKPKKA